MSRPRYYWIKERHNPQLGVYYVACGLMSLKRANEAERPGGYGYNLMHKFETQTAYDAQLATLRANGERVQP